LESPVIERGNGEPDAVHGAGALGNEQRGEGGILPLDANARGLAVCLGRGDEADAVHVTQHEMAAHEAVEPHRALEVYVIARFEIAKRASRQRLGPEVESQVLAAEL